jgi:hypothetical protein
MQPTPLEQHARGRRRLAGQKCFSEKERKLKEKRNAVIKLVEGYSKDNIEKKTARHMDI